MTVDKFIEEYNNASDKEKFVKKHIVNKHIDIARKITDCNRLAQTSCFKDGLFRKDSILQYYLFVTMLIERYTDLELGEESMSDINALEEAEVFEQLVGAIPNKEFSRYKVMLDMATDDICNYEESIVRYIERWEITLKPFVDEFFKRMIDEIAAQAE